MKENRIGKKMNYLIYMKNKIFLFWNFILINLINDIITEDSNLNGTTNFINLNVIGTDYQKIIGSKLFPDLIYVNNIETKINGSGYIFLDNYKVNKVTMYWNNRLNSCENLFQSIDIITKIDLSNFDASEVTSMRNMFLNSIKLEYINFNNINTSSLIDMTQMFTNCYSLKSINLSEFDTSKVKSMDLIFYGCSLLTSINLNNLNTSELTTMRAMFYNCYSLKEINLINIDTSKVTNIDMLFYECRYLTSLNLNNLDTSKVMIMRGVFYNCRKLESLEISKINTSRVYDMSFMFYGCTSLKFLNISNFITSKVNTMTHMFWGCISLISLDLSNFVFDQTEADFLFDQCFALKTIIFSKKYRAIVYGYAMFYCCHSLTSIDINMFIFLGDLSFLFSGCNSLVSINSSFVDTSLVTKMDYIFEDCNSLESIDLSKWSLSRVRSISYMFYGCSSLKYLDLSHFKTSSLIQMKNTFFNCIKLTSLNFTNFDTSSVIDMESMFYGCISLTSLDLSSFDTSLVTNMKSMFFSCSQLTSLDLSNFNTTMVINMASMFSGCRNLHYINFYHYTDDLNIYTSSIFYELDNLIIYIKNINNENIKNIISELPSFSCISSNCSYNWEENDLKIIYNKKICIDNCFNDEKYKFEYQHFCYDKCPIGSHSFLNNTFLCKKNQIECIEKYPFLIIEDDICIDNFISIDFFNGKTSLNKYNIQSQGILITNIIKDIENGEMDKLLDQVINGQKEDIIKKENNVIYQITSSYNQDNKNYKNISSIKLGNCQKILKEKYGISQNESLIIFKTEQYIDGLLMPLIEYEIFNPKSKEKLNIEFCKNENINLEFYLSTYINESILYKYDLNSSYYNDVCNIISNNGIDITLYDRKNEYKNNYMFLCPNNCTFTKYNSDIKKVFCQCKPQSRISLFHEINKEILINNFIIEKRITNLDIMKCTKLIFSKNGLSKNICSYIILSIIFIYIFSSIYFYLKGYDLLCNKINELLNNKNMENIKEIKSKKIIKGDNEKLSKKSNNIIFDKINKRNRDKFNADFKIPSEINLSNDTLNIKENNENKETEIQISKNCIDYEINTFSFENAKKNDNRTYFQYYISLIKLKQKIIFSFFLKNDYNSNIIKICLFFFSFSLYLFVNALFFNDTLMHRIYQNNGNYDIVYNIPPIIFSILICSVIDLIIKRIILTQRDILGIKYEKNKYNIKPKAIIVIKCIIIKNICFFLISIIILILFWYYLSCFCAVYKNTQKHLIVNSLMSFIISMLYPFIICLIPGIFRIPSLKGSGECLYKISKIIQIL